MGRPSSRSITTALERRGDLLSRPKTGRRTDAVSICHRHARKNPAVLAVELLNPYNGIDASKTNGI